MSISSHVASTHKRLQIAHLYSAPRVVFSWIWVKVTFCFIQFRFYFVFIFFLFRTMCTSIKEFYWRNWGPSNRKVRKFELTAYISMCELLLHVGHIFSFIDCACWRRVRMYSFDDFVVCVCVCVSKANAALAHNGSTFGIFHAFAQFHFAKQTHSLRSDIASVSECCKQLSDASNLIAPNRDEMYEFSLQNQHRSKRGEKHLNLKQRFDYNIRMNEFKCVLGVTAVRTLERPLMTD